jgi:ribonucleoside-triphosphate reductase
MVEENDRKKNDEFRTMNDELKTTSDSVQHSSFSVHHSEEAVTGPDVELFVRGSDEKFVRFDPQRIIDALVLQYRLDSDVAAKISLEIKQIIARSGIRALSSSLIRELVSAKLIEYGLESAHHAHTRLGVPLTDAERIIRLGGREISSYPHGPEGSSLTLAEAIKREYAIVAVFSEEVAHADMTGDIHIQGIGAIDRPSLLVSSVDFLKRHGLALPQNFSAARPARHPEVLLAHLVKFTAALQGTLAGPVVWDSLNFALAPFLKDLDAGTLRQLAQSLIFDMGYTAVARGGQLVACDIHLDWDAPSYLAGAVALGPGGEATGKVYADYTESARAFLHALFEVYLQGDASGRPFMTPRPILHITDQFAAGPGYRSLLDLVSQTIVQKGGIKIAFDRVSQRSDFWRFGLPLPSDHRQTQTWHWRSAVLQAVAINLPRIGYQSDRQLVKVFEGVTRIMEVAAQAHLQKHVFLEKLMALSERGPLALLGMRTQNSHEPFLRFNSTICLLCPVGIDELVFHLTGQHLHESDDAVETALRLLAHIRREAERLSAKHNVRFVVAESGDELTPHRFARQDLRSSRSELAAECVSGDPSTADVHYTSGLKVLPRAPVSALERIRIEGLLHHDDVFGATTSLWLAASEPERPERMAVFISRAFYQTHCVSMLPAPEFTVCLDCGQSTRGLHNTCRHCDSGRVDGLALSTDHYSRLSTWNRGMLAQFRDRYRVCVDLELVGHFYF